MALNTGGFALSALPRAPDVPANIGKIDVQAIYDAVQRGLQAQEQIRMGAPRQSLELAQNATAQDQARAQQATIPSATLAAQNTNLQTAGLAAPDIVAGKRGLVLATNAADTQLERNKGVVAGYLGGQPVERLAAGPLTTTNQTTARDANGNLVTTGTKGVNFGGGAIPVDSSVDTTNTTPVITQIPGGAGGVSPGAIVQSAGPGGKSNVEVVHVPPAIYGATVDTTFREIGPALDEATGKIKGTNYQIMNTSPLGTKPGETVMIPLGNPAPGRIYVDPRGNAPTSPISGNPSAAPANSLQGSGGRIGVELAAKNKLEALNDLAASAETTGAMSANIDKADKAIQDYNQGAMLPNVVRGKLGFLPSVQAVNSAKSQFVSDIMGKLKGAGRVTQQEVQYASAAYPDASQAAEVQQANIQYLRNLADTTSNRRAFEYTAISDGMTPAEAKMAAIHKFPIPPPVNYTPSTVSAVAPAQNLPTVTTQADFDALPAGSAFLTPSGQTRHKP